MKDLKIADAINIILTILLVIVAFCQFNLSNQLGNIAKSAYTEKIGSSKKEIRKITRDIRALFSHKGIDERLEHSYEDNISLARKFSGLLEEGSANYLLVQDPESLKHWFKAISQLQMYDSLTPDKTNTVTIAGNGARSTPSDVELNEMVVGALGIAWREVMEVYQKLGLSMYQSLKDLERKNK
jgi:hypothetical protein